MKTDDGAKEERLAARRSVRQRLEEKKEVAKQARLKELKDAKEAAMMKAAKGKK